MLQRDRWKRRRVCPAIRFDYKTGNFVGKTMRKERADAAWWWRMWEQVGRWVRSDAGGIW